MSTSTSRLLHRSSTAAEVNPSFDKTHILGLIWAPCLFHSRSTDTLKTTRKTKEWIFQKHDIWLSSCNDFVFDPEILTGVLEDVLPRLAPSCVQQMPWALSVVRPGPCGSAHSTEVWSDWDLGKKIEVNTVFSTFKKKNHIAFNYTCPRLPILKNQLWVKQKAVSLRFNNYQITFRVLLHTFIINRNHFLQQACA